MKYNLSMKKHFLFLMLAIGLTSVSYGDYLDDWPDNTLCSWMENPSPILDDPTVLQPVDPG